MHDAISNADLLIVLIYQSLTLISNFKFSSVTPIYLLLRKGGKFLKISSKFTLCDDDPYSLDHSIL